MKTSEETIAFEASKQEKPAPEQILSLQVRDYFNKIASDRLEWKQKSKYYHDDLKKFMRHNIPAGSSVLEIGCGTGDLLASLEPTHGVGVDFSEKMIEIAKQQYPSCEYFVGSAESLPLEKPFDVVILSDAIGLLPDVQKAFEQLKRVTTEDSRVIITYYNYLWEPICKLLEALHLKMPQPTQNWLPLWAIQNLLYLSGFEVIKKGYRLLFPANVPFLSTFLNRFVAKLPLIQQLCLVEWVIAKPISKLKANEEMTCSVIVPCRNERDNIINAVTKTPKMGRDMEIIFVDGNSSDGTVEEIKRMQTQYPDKKIKLIHQPQPKGKYDAVKMGFDIATGDVLMILDADLTVPPEDLSKFFNALLQGKGEFINGTRLVYPMEKQAMRMLNLFGNKFFGMAFSYLLEQRFSDTLCGTKVFTKANYAKIVKGRAYFGDFDPFGDFDMIFGASKLNLKIVELPIRYRERVYGSTKIRRFYHGWLLLQMCWVAMKKLKFV
jgi:ubiquinone/menaquinone biosynthesis C-methylase UbiE